MFSMLFDAIRNNIDKILLFGQRNSLDFFNFPARFFR